VGRRLLRYAEQAHVAGEVHQAPDQPLKSDCLKGTASCLAHCDTHHARVFTAVRDDLHLILKSLYLQLGRGKHSRCALLEAAYAYAWQNRSSSDASLTMIHVQLVVHVGDYSCHKLVSIQGRLTVDLSRGHFAHALHREVR
jgi:hypothetical protein